MKPQSHLVTVASIWLLPVVTLLGCQKSNDTNSVDSLASVVDTSKVASHALATATQQGTNLSKPMNIDWAKIDSGVKNVDKATFAYPFKLDSEPVKAYAEVYQVDPVTARYNLTVGMAVNEVLNKVLDQIGTAYVSHELTAGKDSKFIIHTTQSVVPSEYSYVFAEPFAKGLNIPVQVINDGVKDNQQPNPHASLVQP